MYRPDSALTRSTGKDLTAARTTLRTSSPTLVSSGREQPPLKMIRLPLKTIRPPLKYRFFHHVPLSHNLLKHKYTNVALIQVLFNIQPPLVMTWAEPCLYVRNSCLMVTGHLTTIFLRRLSMYRCTHVCMYTHTGKNLAVQFAMY